MNAIERLQSARVLAILRMEEVATSGVATAYRLHRAGVRAIECTLDQGGALDAIAELGRSLGADTVVGAGTVMTTAQIDDLVSIGAEFCVTPHLDADLLTYALGASLPMIPGVMTPSELATALRLGAPAVKLFPAGPLGIGYLKALRGPFGNFAVIPTGGIDVGEVPAWLAAGSLCVGLGSALTGPDGVPAELVDILTPV